MKKYGVMLLMTAFAASAFAAEGGEHITVLNPDGSPAGQHSPLEFIGGLLFWELVAFAILLIILGKVAFPKMFGAMARRQGRIEEALEKAERVRSDAETLLHKHEKMIAESHAEAKRITDEAVAAAEKIRADAREHTRAETADIVARAKNEIRLAQTKALGELKEQAVELSLMAGSAVLGRSLTDDDHRRMAREAIQKATTSLKN